MIVFLFVLCFFFFFNDTATTEIYTLSLHDALPISASAVRRPDVTGLLHPWVNAVTPRFRVRRSMTRAASRIPDSRAARSDELPGVRAGDDLADPVHRVRRAGRRLRREPFVVAHVGVDDQLGTGGVVFDS